MPDMEIFNKLRQVSTAYQETCLLGAAAEFDLFTAILQHNNRLSAGGAATICGTGQRGIERLLDALTATGYLVKSEQSYAVAEPYRELLDSRSESTFVPMLRHMMQCQRSWTQLALCVKTDAPTKEKPGILTWEEADTAFILAMNSIARMLVGPMIDSLKKAGVLNFKKDPIRFIDIGGASGTYTLALFQALPTSRGVIFDRPVGIREARKRFTGTEFESRLDLVEGDFYADEFPGDVDFAWISAIIHQHDRNASPELYKKTFRALNPGGTIAIRDFVMNRDRTAPKDGALFGINMLVNTTCGMVYTEEEIRADLEAAGFIDVRLAVPAETMSAVMVATRP